eukprot:TRINITY_DN35_c0_g1_i1.p1 TRINITY_DN35_c0_g1~~TRINITY_DN35_c0_g1_i1.p1  ORF type:complete len:235 (+),score=47.50 TRINITY_DN35_c0_g1_i1:91-795(+)
MKIELVLVALLLVCTSFGHVCWYEPTQRGLALTASEWGANNTAALTTCRRNIQVSPWGNGGTAMYGGVCGGNADHPSNTNGSWSKPGPIPTPNVYVAGSTVTLSIFENRAHPEVNGSRSSWFYIDYATTSNPSSTKDFIHIASIAATETNNAQVAYDWTIPSTLNVDAGVLRVVYFTGLKDVDIDPTLTGISNSYTSCADIRITAVAPSLVPSGSPCPACECSSANKLSSFFLW